jgi:alpha-tubulin suppressor-like RCC1 family protein
VAVKGIREAVKIASGSVHSCARISNGDVYCWGGNASGQLGDGTRAARSSPVKAGGVSGAVHLAAGVNQTCAIVSSGEIVCWGDPYDPERASGADEDGGGSGAKTNGNAEPPARQVIAGVPDAKQIAIGVEHACAVSATGSVVCWGRRVEEFHVGKLPSRQEGLRRIQGIDDALEVAVGRLHGCVLRQSGSVSCWGYNRYGQIGDGTRDTRELPVILPKILDAVSVSAGRDHTCAALADGSVSCWGGRFPRGRGTSSTFVGYGEQPTIISDLKL